MKDETLLAQAMIDYIYALENKPHPTGDTLIRDIALEIKKFAAARFVGRGIPSREDSAYKHNLNRNL
jgi:hypothetical protein